MEAANFIKLLGKQREILRKATAHKGERRTPISSRTDLSIEYSDNVRATLVWNGSFKLTKNLAFHSPRAPFQDTNHACQRGIHPLSAASERLAESESYTGRSSIE